MALGSSTMAELGLTDTGLTYGTTSYKIYTDSRGYYYFDLEDKTLYSHVWGNYYNSTSSYQYHQCEVIASYFTAQGWTLNAIAAMCGNMQKECAMNCNLYAGKKQTFWNWQQSGYNTLYSNLTSEYNDGTRNGWGLTQWTPGTKCITWCYNRGLDWRLAENQLARIQYECENNMQWYSSRLGSNVAPKQYTFAEWTQLEEDPGKMAWWFNRAYEVSASSFTSSTDRQENATRIYNHLAGTDLPYWGGAFDDLWMLFKIQQANKMRRWI